MTHSGTSSDSLATRGCPPKDADAMTQGDRYRNCVGCKQNERTAILVVGNKDESPAEPGLRAGVGDREWRE